MKARQLAVALVTLAGIGGLGALVTAEGDQPRVRPTFSALPAPSPPFAPQTDAVTSSWFCAGVPAGGEGLGGRVSVVNPSDSARTGRLTVFTDAAGVPPVEERFSIDARSLSSFTLTELQPQGTFLGALVEIDGGGGLVEQEAFHPSGNAVAACNNKASSQWFFADGFTAGGSLSSLVITNPYPDDAVVSIEFATPKGPVRFARNTSFIVPGYSVKTVSEAQMPKDETVLATKVTSARGRVVVGRAQQYNGAGRLGYTLNLGAPSPSSQYWFADGEKNTAEGVVETYTLYNPTESAVSVGVTFLGLPAESGFLYDTPIDIPAGGVASLNTADIPDLPEGRHSVVFGSFDASFVVERAITRPAGDSTATTVVTGMSTSTEIARRWTAVVGVDQALENVLVVSNLDGVDGTLKVSALAAGGIGPVPGLEEVSLPAGAVITIAITDPSAIGVPLIIESEQRMVVERLLARGPDLRGRSGSLAIPG
jgi:Family of unknown function (DUF5719)